jgi:GNAT superfamily N-acetyltransferase
VDALSHRLASERDIPAIAALMERAIRELQAPFLTPDQIAASRASMGLDTRLIADRTYFAIEAGGGIVGCGGWSRRATLYGGDHAAGLRDDRLLDPAREPARVRAMYTNPDHARRGIGRLVLSLCEAAARAEGFARVELMATAAGEPLYTACGYRVVERVERLSPSGVAVPGAVMAKALV